MFWTSRRRKIRIQAGPPALRIVIAYWVGWPAFVFLVFWTMFWAMYWLGVGTHYFEKTTSVVGLAVMIWLIFGRERITFRGQSMTIFRGMFGVGRYLTFSLRDIHDMRVGAYLNLRAGQNWDSTHVRAVICFESQGKTQRFGDGLGKLEADRILEATRRYQQQES